MTTNHPRVLIVEDDALVASDLKEIVLRLGYRVVGLAATGSAAVEQALREKPAAILMDIRLRGPMTGIQAAEKIRKTDDIPLIYLTAFSEESLLEQAKMTEAYAYLVKPVRERELGVCLDMAVYKHAAERKILHLNQVLMAVRSVNQLLARESDPQRLLDGCCEILVRTRGYRLVWIGRLETEGRLIRPVAKAGSRMDYLDGTIVTWDESPTGKGPTGTAARTRASVVYKDLLADSDFGPWKEKAVRHGLVASAAVPILIGETLYGVLNVYADTADIFSDEEVGLLVELAEDLALALRTREEETARKRAETALAASEEKYRTLVDNAGEAIVVAQDGLLKYANPKVRDISGYAAEELVDLPFLQLVHPEDRAMVGERHARRLRGEAFLQSYSFRILDKAGRPRWMDVHAALIAWDGRPAALTFLNDVTDRRLTDAALRDSELKFQAVFQNSRDAIVVSRNGRHIFANPAYLRLYGYDRYEELAGLPVFDLVAPLQRKRIADFIRRRHCGEEAPALYESRGLRKDGSEFDTEIQASTFELNGDIHVLAVIRDINEPKKAG
jgi:PAS domain S-box-containing protein